MTAPGLAPSRRPRAERGVALLIVLVVLFIIAVLMVDITLTATTARRSARNASDDFLMDAAVEGHFLVMLAQIRYDKPANTNAFDSPDDRWAQEEYTQVKPPVEEEDPGMEEEEGGSRLLGDSDEVAITAKIVPENAKFNLNLLMHPDAKKREAARERFAVLLDRFREDTPLDISRTRAEELRDRVVEYLERATPGPGESGKFPVAASARPWRLLTPDELRYVEGFEDTAHGLGAEGLLYEAREPNAAREYSLDPENVERPESYKGLLHYVTLWSGEAWAAGTEQDRVGKADTWLGINVNFAEKPILETLFYKDTANFMLADRIIEYRDSIKEGSEEPIPGAAAAPDEPLPLHQYFENPDDLKEVDGMEAIYDKEEFHKAAVVTTSDTFSLDFLARMGKSVKQIRYVVRRHDQGTQVLLREERADPRFDEEEEGPPDE